MFSVQHRLSPREHTPRAREPLWIPASDGIKLYAQMVRPTEPGRYPLLLSVHAYGNDDQFCQTDPNFRPISFGPRWTSLESGPIDFYVRHGYIHVVMNVRGTDQSEGLYQNLDQRSVDDVVEAIAWLAGQDFCDGNVGMVGVSYFAIVQQLVAARNPPHLKAIFAPFGYSDMYRDRYYRGGILAHGFMQDWVRRHFLSGKGRSVSMSQFLFSNEEWQAALARAKADPEIAAEPFLVEALEHAEENGYSIAADILLQPELTSYFEERSTGEHASRIPAYLGGCWGIYGLHLGGALREYQQWKGPRRLTIGPPLYLERPIHQYAYESLRWFDHWLKGNDTGMMDEAPVQVFIEGTGEWKSASEWPIPGTWWTPFYLHQRQVLSEHEFWTDDHSTIIDDAPGAGGTATFVTAPFVEATEICGPISLDVYASTTDTELLWYASLWLIESDGNERLLTRGWLRGTHRELDPERSRPWQPVHPHRRRQAIVPGQVELYNIEIRPYGLLLQPGQQLALKLRCRDDEPPRDVLQQLGQGGIWRPNAARITILHDAEHPSALHLPITRGNRIGTYLNGGTLLPAPGWGEGFAPMEPRT
ncbi:CocE/NonD family hydrolase [Achromobacter insolitus]|uniref:CocE/NonD family hydrolase n=1 Tax=Achromobacter insolitus TaxID=217204 RepID=UPI002FDDE304